MDNMKRTLREAFQRLVSFRLLGFTVMVMGSTIILACNDAAEDLSFSANEMEAIALPSAMEAGNAQGSDRSRQDAAPGQPRLIRNGTVRLEVDDLDTSITTAQSLVDEVQGFVAGSNLTEGNEGSRTASLTLRVPSASFQVVVDRLSQLGRVLSVSISASDVSREYFDLETRIAVKDQTVGRLRELITRSGDLEDLLAVERELGRATAELESLKGQITYYDQRLAMSDLRVDLFEPGAAITPGLSRPVREAFRNSVSILAKSLAALIYVLASLVPWLILAAILWPVIRRIGRFLQPKNEPPSTGVEE